MKLLGFEKLMWQMNTFQTFVTLRHRTAYIAFRLAIICEQITNCYTYLQISRAPQKFAGKNQVSWHDT